MFHCKCELISGITRLLIKTIVLSVCFLPICAHAKSDVELSSGESVYVSIYSNIYSGPKAVRLELAAMLSIRNTDPKYPITILKADYYDTSGKMIDSYVKKPLKLKPLETTYVYIKEYDKRGGPGANFIVKWQAEKKVNQPIIEGVMLGTRQGVSFICPGQIITEHSE
ncbi:MAG: hypothetical protein A2Z47_03205 [Thermodesulfovibrio sp. RBG_19FT_COMBO_42_12]|nr:MAG: hypothetical protein A2Z47_03205 [Thermodesulfovibrio sp. RBG_19FT_COMBO_42_12]